MILTIDNVDAQILTGDIRGYICRDNRQGRTGSVKVKLSNFSYSDSVILDQYTDSFVFRNCPYGIYELMIDANRGQTGLKDHVIEDITLQSDQINLDTIVLFSVRTCGDNAQIWYYKHSLPKKEPKEYYETGELRAEGQYFLAKKYSRKAKSNSYSYQKDGIWKYYFQSGSLSEYRYYDKDILIKVTAFHENGKLKYNGSYKNCKEGEWSYFDEGGTLLFKMEYINTFGKPPSIRINYEYWKAFLSLYRANEVRW